MYLSNVKGWKHDAVKKFVIKNKKVSVIEAHTFSCQDTAELWWKHNEEHCEKECHPIETVETWETTAEMHTLEDLTIDWCAWAKWMVEEDSELTPYINYVDHYIHQSLHGRFTMLVEHTDLTSYEQLEDTLKELSYYMENRAKGIHIEFELNQSLHNNKMCEITACISVD